VDLQKAGGDLRVLFFAVWLTFWSVGVAVIQGLLLGGLFGGQDVGVGSLVPLLFLLTHGGSEVMVQRQVSKQVRENAERPSRVQVEQDVGGQVVTWRRGSPTVIQWVATYLLPVLTLLILLAPAGITLFSGAATFSMVLAVLFAVGWVGIMAWAWLPTWRAQGRSTDTVELRIEPHQIRVTEQTTTGTHTHRFPAHAVSVLPVTGRPQARCLMAGEHEWQGDLPEAARQALDQARPALEQARREQAGAQVPEELEHLRRSRQGVEG